MDSDRSSTKPGAFWDTGVETDGSGLGTESVSIGSCVSRSSGGSDVSIASSTPDKTNKGELRPPAANTLLTAY